MEKDDLFSMIDLYVQNEYKRRQLKSAVDAYSSALLQQCNVSGSLPITADPFEFIADSMEKELRLRQMIDDWCIGQFGNTDEALEKAENMFVAARDTFYRR